MKRRPYHCPHCQNTYTRADVVAIFTDGDYKTCPVCRFGWIVVSTTGKLVTR